MRHHFYHISLAVLLSFTGIGFTARADEPAHTNRVTGRDLTVSYAITLKSRKKDNGIGETYNGGVKTVFASDALVRLRLVSLMRMQSIFIMPAGRPHQRCAIVKESGRSRYKYYLSDNDWRLYNEKYEGLACQLTGDTAHVLGYVCKKAIITLKNKKTVIVYYTPSIQKPMLSGAEPLFASVPGLVLKYEYAYRKNSSIVYTATAISQNSIEPEVFVIPGNEFPTRKYTPDTNK
jgi:hypothetical protein